MSLYTAEGDARFATSIRASLLFILPIVAIVQFFYVEPLWLAIVVAILIMFLLYLIFTAKYIYEFDGESKKFRKATEWLGKIRKGEWQELDIKCNHISFQMYDDTYTMNFMNLSKNEVKETMYVLRLVNENGSYSTLLETPYFSALPSVLVMANALSKAYNVPFKDHIRNIVTKKGRKRV